MKSMTVFVLICALGFSFKPQSDKPIVRTADAFEENCGKEVVLIGTYTPLLLPQSKRPGSKPVPSGRVSIRLGELDIALDRGQKGLRDKAEIKKFSGKTVKVHGYLNKMVNLWGNGTEQSIVMPAITDITLVTAG